MYPKVLLDTYTSSYPLLPFHKKLKTHSFKSVLTPPIGYSSVPLIHLHLNDHGAL